MANKGISQTELENDLKAISEKGISADRKKLKEDMCAQFSDYREWAREYVVNAFDARAGYCKISGSEEEKTLTIRVEDNGHGMDRQGIVDFFTLFRSIKRGPVEETIGCHGAGKLSIAAIPDQSGFSMQTSTGKECWQLETGSLLDDDPVTIHRIEPVPSQGTVFEITFAKANGLTEELSQIATVLKKYCKYLPMEIMVMGTTSDGISATHPVNWIGGDWNSGPEMMPSTYRIEEYGKNYEVILGVGQGQHSIYQNRVLISTTYCLLTGDNKLKLDLPYLDIRVNSPDFKPTFGRNRLTNEGFVHDIAIKIEESLLPRYITQLCEHYLADCMRGATINISHFEALILSIIKHNHTWIPLATTLPLFNVKNGDFLSFAALQEQVEKQNRLYLEESDSSGVDYTIFDAPVLAVNQPYGGLDVIKHYFSSALINLGANDIVIEAPEGSVAKLGKMELTFQENLGFHPEALINSSLDTISSDSEPGGMGGMERFTELKERGFLETLCEESFEAQGELGRLSWKVSYLVERDGKTPNETRQFLQKDNVIILNLFHKRVKQLLKVSQKAPALAGHWAMAMCISEGNNILKHLTPEAREDLLLLDAMTRCGNHSLNLPTQGGDTDSYTDLVFEYSRRNLDLWI